MKIEQSSNSQKIQFFGKKILMFTILLIMISSVYAANEEIIRKISDEMDTGLRPGNEPFLLQSENTTTAILLIHGFTASPWEVREMSEYLVERNNVTIYGPLLPGHGTTAEELRKTTWEDWYEKVNLSYTMLKADYDCVYVGGMSTGSSLALMLAAEHDVCGIIAIGTPVYFQDWKIRFAWLAKYVMPYTTRPLTPDVKPYYYEKRPTAAVAQLFEMVSIMNNKLQEVKEPILIIQSLADKTIKPKSAEHILTSVGSDKKIFIWFEKGEHVIIKDEQKEEVFKLVDEFIKT